jgi:hypothetical protein
MNSRSDPFGNLMAIFASVGRVSPVVNTSLMGVKVNPYGLKMGWCGFPWNFDPIWIDACDCFESKEIANVQKAQEG